jgi:hypothetical protein
MNARLHSPQPTNPQHLADTVKFLLLRPDVDDEVVAGARE